MATWAEHERWASVYVAPALSLSLLVLWSPEVTAKCNFIVFLFFSLSLSLYSSPLLFSV